MTFTHSVASNNFGCAKWIVSANVYEGTHTTIGAAITSASAGDTIFIRPGTYTENLTLKNGVNLACYDYNCGSGGRTTIVGTLIDNGGVVGATLTNINLQTNSANIITLTGSGSTILLEGCALNCSNNSGISVAAGTTVDIYNCTGNLGTTGIGFWSGAGSIVSYNSLFTNSGASLSASTTSGSVLLNYVTMASALSTSSGGIITLNNCAVDNSAINTICLTTAGTGSSIARNSTFISGTASALSIGTGTTLNASLCTINSTNTNAITGAGTLVSTGISYTGSSHLSNVTTQTGGAINGLTQGTAPSAGMIGETINANVASGSHVSLGNSTATTITSISLTPGNWIVFGTIAITGITTGTAVVFAINTTTNNIGTEAVNYNVIPASSASDQTINAPIVYATLSATTTYYLVAQANYTVGTAFGFGKIQAVRVG